MAKPDSKPMRWNFALEQPRTSAKTTLSNGFSLYSGWHADIDLAQGPPASGVA
jgi:hypothetical protein